MLLENAIEAIEEINKEYFRITENETKEYKIGKKLLSLKKNFPFHMFSFLKSHNEWKRKQKKIDELYTYVPIDKVEYASGPLVLDKKGVVYSCITAGYDIPFEPLLQNEALAYRLFTDINCKPENTAWDYLPIIDKQTLPGTNSANRYYKFHPFEFLDGYDYSIYIDGNVQVVSDITSLYRVAAQAKTGIAMHRHAHMDCGYLDAKWCEYNNRGNIVKIKEQTERYHNEGFPNHFGLCEATIIVVDLHNPTAKHILKSWWDEFIESGSGRDQLAFPYILWKNGFDINDVGNLGNDEYHNPKFRIHFHKGKLF